MEQPADRHISHCACYVWFFLPQMTDALKNLLTAMWEMTPPEDREPFEKKEADDQARCVDL